MLLQWRFVQDENERQEEQGKSELRVNDAPAATLQLAARRRPDLQAPVFVTQTVSLRRVT
jgi:hypothetical protein